MLRVFRNRPRYVTVRSQDDRPTTDVPDNLWTRCDSCSSMIYSKELEKSVFVCSSCGFHFRLSAQERLQLLIDEASFAPFEELRADNPLGFPGYEEKLTQTRESTGLQDAILIGKARIHNHPAIVGVIDFSFIGGSMGSVVGEQLSRAFERGQENKVPVVVISGGGGGARMQEGIFSLMQMAKTAQAVGRFRQRNLFYLSILTNPTMGGIYASFASLGDVILAEPRALIGFAGPRIVEETTRQKLPSEFQTSEFALKNGMIDAIVQRNELRDTVGRLLSYH